MTSSISTGHSTGRSRRLLSVLFLGFSSGIPLALTGATLQAWMTTENVDLTVIGLFSLVGLPYALKFLWSPLMDRYVPPLLGRRRGWVLITQFALILGVGLMAFSAPAAHPGATALLAFLVAFFGASQDIVIDAYRTDVLEGDEIGPGASFHVTGYRLAMLVSGSLSLILADHLPWKIVYLLMALTLGVGVLATFLAPEPRVVTKPPPTLGEAIVLPFVEFFKRPGALEILFFIVLYKIDVVMAVALTTPFMLGLGFTKTDIGAVTKGFGLISSIVGTLGGGALMVRLGLLRSLVVFGLIQAISNLTFMGLSMAGHSYAWMVASITIENICSGMGNAAFFAFIMSVCDKRFTATQFALLSSLMALTRVIAGAPTGFLVKSLGWTEFFVVCTFASAPGLLLLIRFKKWNLPNAETQT